MAQRFLRKVFFLTYSQANDVSKDDIKAVILPFRPIKLCIGEELHQDGGTHFHVLFAFKNPYNLRDMSLWDVKGIHPNIQAARMWKNALEYCIKGGNYDNMGWDLDEPTESMVQHISTLINDGAENNEAVRATVQAYGDKALKYISQLQQFAEVLRRPNAKYPAQRSITSFKLKEEVSSALIKFMEDVRVGCGDRGDRKSIWFYGASRMGKTELARSIGTHWYMQGTWNLERYDDDADYGVLDDIPWENLQRYYKGIMGLQKDVTVTDKYRRKTVIKGGKPVIVVSNNIPDFSTEEKNWLDMNVVFVGIHEKVYDEGMVLYLSDSE